MGANPLFVSGTGGRSGCEPTWMFEDVATGFGLAAPSQAVEVDPALPALSNIDELVAQAESIDATTKMPAKALPRRKVVRRLRVSKRVGARLIFGIHIPIEQLMHVACYGARALLMPDGIE